MIFNWAKSRTTDFKAGDVGYIPRTFGHYMPNQAERSSIDIRSRLRQPGRLVAARSSRRRGCCRISWRKTHGEKTKSRFTTDPHRPWKSVKDFHTPAAQRLSIDKTKTPPKCH